MACIAYRAADNLTDSEDHEAMVVLRQMPEELRNFDLAVNRILEDNEDDPALKKFSFERNRK